MGSATVSREPWLPEEFEKGLVTVIIPTYNRANILPEALDSVWAQTYRPIELIVVDDGSIDNTDQVVESWRHDHQGDGQFELRLFRQQNGGAHSARNRGLIHSRGEYIQHLDSDDALYPDMISQVVMAFESSHSGFVLVGYDKVCQDCGKALYRYVPEPFTDALAMYMRGKLFGNSISIARRRSLVQQIGAWDESLLNDADGNYLVRTILVSPRMAVVGMPLFAYLVRRGPKLCDTKGSCKSWMCYVQRETLFCEGIKGREGIPVKAKGAYAERLYKFAVSLNAGRMLQIGDAFGVLADGIEGAALTWRGSLLRRVWKSGRTACVGYEWVRRIKQGIRGRLRGKNKKRTTCSTCGH